MDHPAPPDETGSEEPFDPHLVHELAKQHPECLTLGDTGLRRMEMAELMGLVPLGLPLPKGRRDILVPAERREAVVREIVAGLDRARRRNALLEQGRRALSGSPVALRPAETRGRVRAVMAEDLPWPGLPHAVRVAATRSLDIDELAGLTDEELHNRLTADPALANALQEGVADVAERLWRYTEEVGEPEDSWTFAHLGARLSRANRAPAAAADILKRWDEVFDTWRRDRAEARGRSYVDRHFDFARFERLFPTARSLGRRLVLVIGPTNSGKTHEAIQALHRAQSGLYLAPLRLLALEVMDRLNREGTPTTLLTGEEEIRIPGARHTASTVEMLDPERIVDVAVVDEVQMLADPDRGWAWTAALMGVPARTVYLLGAPEARPLIERAAAHLGEALEVVELERKAPLTLIERRLEWGDVEPGDALIAFSRREVHAVRDILRGRGLSAAAIYGALAPEVRRAEAERFNSGEADVVVATDAIGMGLNLPVRRVLFTALEKFDGVAVRPLASSEIRQIAGRAGRYGRFEAGEFGVVAKGTPTQLRTLLERPDFRIAPGMPLTVRPSRAMLGRLADYIETHDLALVVDCFATAKTSGSPYRVADLAPLRQLAALLDGRSLDFSDKLDLLFIPADLDKEGDATLFRAILRAVETETPMPVGHALPARIDRLGAEELEELSRACDLYYWSARRFPDLFPDREIVTQRRAAISERLSEVLASRARRPGGGKAPPPKPGFRGAPRKRFGPRRR
ncbi:MAG TPA: helicase-related protein [Alphaproteobacteria bacterium]|nr:helicase-related protein [Alphaproteobacteria bacterium]